MRATEIRSGHIIRHEGIVGIVVEAQHRTPGNKGGFMQVKFRDINTGTLHNAKILTLKDVERIILDKRPCQYLYQDGDMRIFMDNESYEQFPLPNSLLESALPYMKLNSSIDVLMMEGKPVSVELPASVILQVQETEQVARGDTANAVTKNALMETGLNVKVPAHIKMGDNLKINTQSGEFLERVR
jgi:elongation factor P